VAEHFLDGMAKLTETRGTTADVLRPAEQRFYHDAFIPGTAFAMNTGMAGIVERCYALKDCLAG
jgi:hypothetical protein